MIEAAMVAATIETHMTRTMCFSEAWRAMSSIKEKPTADDDSYTGVF